MIKYLTAGLKRSISTILIFTTFFALFISKSKSEENVFIINNVEVKGIVDINFSRDKYINKALFESFEMLKSRILLSRSLNEVDEIELNKLKNLVNSFQILEENYVGSNYRAIFKVFYDEVKVKNFLIKKNISFSQPKSISAIFFPVLFIDDEMQDFGENFFYNKWSTVEIKNNLINFILPLEELDDISEIKKMKNNVEKLNVSNLTNKYNIKNYAFLLMDYNNNKLNVHIKTSFGDNDVNKNVSYKINDIRDETQLSIILKDLKIHLIDIWKESNIINLLMPLTIRIKFEHKTLKDLDRLKAIFYKISIIDNYNLEEFNINHSYFKIYYYGNPKRLKKQLSKFNYHLKDDKGYWEIYINE